MADVPSVDDVRPATCPSCACAARPLGRHLAIVGHGLRERQQRGPLVADGVPREITIRVRRYRCKPCGAIIVVVPSGVVRRRLFSAPAIALALALFGLLGLCVVEIRRRVSPWQTVGHTAKDGWAQLGRWTRAIRKQALFSCVRSCPGEFSGRQVAERAAGTLVALASPRRHAAETIEAKAFRGAKRAA
jgi:hypothetical protein